MERKSRRIKFMALGREGIKDKIIINGKMGVLVAVKQDTMNTVKIGNTTRHRWLIPVIPATGRLRSGGSYLEVILGK
jgi:hypothetical protein